MPGDDRGMVTTFFVIFVPVVLLFVGLVYEGGEHLSARRDAYSAAAGAARAAAQALDPDQTRFAGEGGPNRLDPVVAESEAQAYMGNALDTCDLRSVDVYNAADHAEVTVAVDCAIDVRLLPGLPATVRAEATACAEYGIAESVGECDVAAPAVPLPDYTG